MQVFFYRDPNKTLCNKVVTAYLTYFTLLHNIFWKIAHINLIVYMTSKYVQKD